MPDKLKQKQKQKKPATFFYSSNTKLSSVILLILIKTAQTFKVTGNKSKKWYCVYIIIIRLY